MSRTEEWEKDPEGAIRTALEDIEDLYDIGEEDDDGLEPEARSYLGDLDDSPRGLAQRLYALAGGRLQ